MRQAYDYWQDQPGSTLDDAGTHEPPRASGGSTRTRPSFVSSEERLIGRAHPRRGSMPAQCSASRSTPGGHSPSRVRTAAPRRWTTAPARMVHPTPQGGIERKIISLGSELPSQGMQHRKPSIAQGLPAPGSSREKDRAWTVHRSSREPANTNEPNVTHAPPRVPAEMSPACPPDYGT